HCKGNVVIHPQGHPQELPMAKDPQDLKYTKDHEWVRVSDSHLVIGVTDHAQESLGDVVYVELPKVGAELTSGTSFGTIESTKAVSELFAPVKIGRAHV